MKVSQENYQVNKKSLDVPRENEDPLFPTVLTLKLRFLNLNGNSILMNFLSVLHIVEWIFEYKELPDDKKVKLIALILQKYASLWWTNLSAKRVRNHKEKIRTWEKMKAKLKAAFLPLHMFKITIHNFITLPKVIWVLVNIHGSLKNS